MTITNLDVAERTFETRPNEQTAMNWLEIAKTQWHEADISDEELAKVLRRIAYWLEFN